MAAADGEYIVAHNPHPLSPPRLPLPALNFHRAWWFADAGTERGSAPTKQMLLGKVKALLERSLDARNGIEILSVNGEIGRPVKGQAFPFTFMGHAASLDASGGATAQIKANLLDVDRFTLWLGWRDMRVRLHMAVHSEYFTISLWTLFTRKQDENDFNNPNAVRVPCVSGELKPHLAKLWRPLLSAHNKRLHPSFAATVSRKKEATSEAATALYDTHNDDLFLALFPPEAGSSDFGGSTMFADFRSVILPSEPLLGSDVATIDSKLKRPGPILDAMAGVFNGFNTALPELMGSLFLDERVVYVSSLGTHHLADKDSAPAIPPVRYLMYADNVCSWQMGRLIERLNTLGTYRLASLRHLKALNEIGDTLEAIGETLGKELDLTDGDALQKTFTDQFNAFNRLSPANGETVSFRVDRSRFYVDAFTRLVRDLHDKRVPGFQSYPDFVRRRYGATWDRIDRIGLRHEKLAKRLDYLSNLAQAVQLRLAADAQKNLAEEQTAQTLALNEAARAQVGLLHTAERVSVIPVAYYFKPAMEAMLAKARSLHLDAFFLNMTLFAGVMLIVNLYHMPTKNRHAEREALGWLLVLAVALKLAGWIGGKVASSAAGH
ncbi:DUF3422 family protein [Sandarakinorhabdus sp. AAP62]|uniref:DUF3422 family protein n=1 Tax=Sandarakinorhabdus sp. AAP62 TaxID=1248916 RepID=UPI0002F70518|nr:DUF3422 family protein [Sandarakinorhabdus sp. AAP62]